MPNDLFRCSFCYQVIEPGHFAITGPDAIMMCDNCVDLCTLLLAEYRAHREVEDAERNVNAKTNENDKSEV